MTDPLALAYLAGVFDSDGYITVHRSVRKVVPYFAAQVGIAGTRRQPHDLAASVWGGNVHCYTPKNLRHRPQFQWTRTGDVALRVILDVLPYLRVKKEQAWIAVEAQEHVIAGRGEDPYPWLPPDYDPTPGLHTARETVVRVLNQDRHAAGRQLDGRTWDEYPDTRPQAVPA